MSDRERDEAEPETVHAGKHLRFLNRAGWEYVQREKAKGVVAVLAMTDDNKVVLCEQFRPPVQKRVIEIPAGLAGDIPYQEDEPLVTAAKRELKEETGYVAERWTKLTEGPSSAGLTNEMITFFYATGMTRINEGGGDHTEDIKVHFVDRGDVIDWCQRREAEGLLVDFKIYAALYLARAQSGLTEARLWY